jgi:transposase
MAHYLTPTQQIVVEYHLRLGTKHQKIADEIRCSLSQIRHMSMNFNQCGSVVVPKLRKNGRPHQLTVEMIEVPID